MEFYKILQEIMDDKNLTIAEVARMSKLSDSTVRSIITRKSKNVALDVAIKLSEGLNIGLNELNGEKGLSKENSKLNDYVSEQINLDLQDFTEEEQEEIRQFALFVRQRKQQKRKGDSE